MHLTARANNGIKYLYLLESVYSQQKGKSYKKVVRNLGRFDGLPEEVKAIYNDPDLRKRLAQAAETQYRLELTQQPENEGQQKSVGGADKRQAWQAFLSAALEIFRGAQEQEPSAPVDASRNDVFNEAISLHFGHLLLKNFWAHDLGLGYKIGYLQKTQTDITAWSLNDLLFYLCSLKLIDPQSYYSACGYKSNFLYCPWNSIAQDNFYRGLDFVYKHREDLIEHAVKHHHCQAKTDVKLAFFDCTNTWFETPYDDVIWQMRHFSERVYKELQKKQFSQEQIDAYFQSEEFNRRLQEELEQRSDEVLRMRGMSKEGRYAQPIVSVALAIDQTGFPIDCKVFAGNVSESKSIQPVLDSLKSKYNIQDVYFVADRGLNSTATLEELRTRKLGCVVAQKVTMQKPNVRAQMLTLDGYKRCRIQPDGTFATLPGDVVENEFRYKVCDFNKESRIPIEGSQTAGGNCKTRKVSIPCRIIFTFSPERRARDLAELDDQIARASRAVEQKVFVGNASSTGWRALLKTKKEMAQGKEDKELYRACGLKENIIAERREIAGYAAVVYMHPEAQDGAAQVQLGHEQVLSTYHRLVSIEDCFRIMKSNFSIRPMYVRLHQRITAHCYLCVLSLMLLKTMQEKLADQGVNMPAHQICRALADATVIPVPAKDGIRGFIRVGGAIRFHTAQRTGKTGKQVCAPNETIDNAQVWQNYKKDRTAQRSDVDQLMLAAGLETLPYFSTMGQIKRHFGLGNLPDSKIVAYEVQQYVRKLGEAT
ncbi:MAG: transposase [Duodenibacillus sp.]